MNFYSGDLPTLVQVQRWAQQELAASDTAVLDAEILLSHVLRSTRTYLIAHPEHLLTQEQLTQYQICIQRRKQCEPVAYIVGRKGFWSLDLEVTTETLIPRPETELLVETALQKITQEKALIADLGTGSGAIALAVAYERPKWQVVATDYSEAALQVAIRNAERLAIKNVQFIKSNWFSALSTMRFNAIISNPPYISDTEWQSCEPDLFFEPISALVSAESGLQDIKQIIVQGSRYLCESGLLLLEHGSSQTPKVQSFLAKSGYTKISSLTDLAGKERVTSGVWLGSKKYW